MLYKYHRHARITSARNELIDAIHNGISLKRSRSLIEEAALNINDQQSLFHLTSIAF
jgi:hypothetical protein